MSKEAKAAFKECGSCGKDAICEWCGYAPFDCANELIEKLQANLSQVKKANDRSLEFKGACPTCEPVGELNVKLQAELSQLKDKLELSQKDNSHLWDESVRRGRENEKLLENLKAWKKECLKLREENKKYAPDTTEK